jgi:NADH-quinone oxidoreductase subunit G
VRDEALKGVDVSSELNNALQGVVVQPASAVSGLQRVADVPIYATDAVVRRSVPLQATRDALTPRAVMHSDELKKLGLQAGDQVRIKAGQGSSQLAVAADDTLPQGVVRVAAGHAATAGLGAMFGAITVERA